MKAKGGQRNARAMSTGQKLAQAAKVQRAAELTVAGWTPGEIAKELGYANAGSVCTLLTRHAAKLPVQALEERREYLLARIDKAHKAALAMVENPRIKPALRIRAQLNVIRAAEAAARISGVTSLPAPIVQIAVGGPTGQQEFDLSKLSVEEVQQLRAIRLRLDAPPIETTGAPVADVDPAP